MPELVLDEPKKDPRLVLDEPADPKFGSGLYPEFPDLPDFELSDEHRTRMQNSLYYATQYGIPPDMAYDLEPELTKEREKLDLLSDFEKAIKETPENIKIGTIGLAASTMFAVKRRGMMLSGGGIFPDEMVKHQFEPIKPEKREKLVDWRERKRDYVPGQIRPTTKDWPTGVLSEAFGIVTRLPHVAGTILSEKQRKLIEKQDKVTLGNAPVTKMLRSVTQSGVPSIAAAIGMAYLTGDPVAALALLGEMEGGGAFQTQLESGASIMKSNVIADLSEAAEIGTKMLVFPKLFKGIKEGFSFRDAINIVAANATQEGAAGFSQRFLEVFGLETTKGIDAQTAATKALNEGIKAIPENAWVGGATAGGPVMLRGGFDLAVSAKEAITAEKPAITEEPIAKLKEEPEIVSEEKQPQVPKEPKVTPEKPKVGPPSKPLKPKVPVPTVGKEPTARVTPPEPPPSVSVEKEKAITPVEGGVWFHGTHENIKEFKPREVKGIDSIGTWATGDSKKARLYGPKTFQIEKVPENLLEAHTDNFDEFFYSNETLFEKLFPNEPLSIFKSFREAGLKKKDNRSWNMRNEYLSAFKKMLEDAGHDGVIWKNSRIDLAKEDTPHDVVVFFNKKPIKATLTPTPQAKAEAKQLTEGLPQELQLEPVRIKRKLSKSEQQQVSEIKQEISELESQKKNKLGQWQSTETIKRIERQQEELRNQLSDLYETRPPTLQDYKKALKWYEKNKKTEAADVLRKWIIKQEALAEAKPKKVAKKAKKPTKKVVKKAEKLVEEPGTKPLPVEKDIYYLVKCRLGILLQVEVYLLNFLILNPAF